MLGCAVGAATGRRVVWSSCVPRVWLFGRRSRFVLVLSNKEWRLRCVTLIQQCSEQLHTWVAAPHLGGCVAGFHTGAHIVDGRRELCTQLSCSQVLASQRPESNAGLACSLACSTVRTSTAGCTFLVSLQCSAEAHHPYNHTPPR